MKKKKTINGIKWIEIILLCVKGRRDALLRHKRTVSSFAKEKTSLQFG